MVGNLPRIREFEVVGVFDVGMYEYDSSYIFIPLEAAQIYFKQPKGVGEFEVMANDPENVGQVKAELAKALGPGFQLSDWQLATASFFGAVEVERNVMFIILTLIVIVAAFNIISGQIMMVKEKGRNIAIMRTMGATRGAILRVFLLSGASIGVVGTVLGCVAWRGVRAQHRNHPPLARGVDRQCRCSTRRSISSPSCRRSSIRLEVDADRRHGLGADSAGLALSGLARGAARSG